MTIQVRAARLGFYQGRRIREGETFTIQSEKDLGAWMQPVSGKAADKQESKSGTDEPVSLADLRVMAGKAGVSEDDIAAAGQSRKKLEGLIEAAGQ